MSHSYDVEHVNSSSFIKTAVVKCTHLDEQKNGTQNVRVPVIVIHSTQRPFAKSRLNHRHDESEVLLFQLSQLNTKIIYCDDYARFPGMDSVGA